MCISIFVGLDIQDIQEKKDRSRNVKVMCEETILAGVFGENNQIALHLAVNPGHEVVTNLYILTEPPISKPESLNDTWLSNDDPFSVLFKTFPGRIVREDKEEEIDIKLIEPPVMKGILIGNGPLAKDVRPPYVIRPLPAEKGSPFSIMKIDLESALVPKIWNFIRIKYAL